MNRFDIRQMHAALKKPPIDDAKPVYYEPYPNHPVHQDFWFDWIADTGDGGDPTYAVARLLAQHEVRAHNPRRKQAWRRMMDTVGQVSASVGSQGNRTVIAL